MEEAIPITLTFNKNGVIKPALDAMTLAAGIVSICLPAISVTDFANLPKLGDGLFSISFPEGNHDATVSLLQTWLLGKAVQELARGVRSTLEEAYLYVYALKHPPSWKTWDDLNNGIGSIKIKANRLNFPDLVAAVQSELNTKLDFAEEFRSLQAARNCLEHRNGIVSAIDLNNGSEKLELRLPRIKIFTLEDGKENEIVVGYYAERDTRILMRREFRLRSFAIGDKITISPSEFHEVAFACWFFAHDVESKLPNIPQ